MLRSLFRQCEGLNLGRGNRGQTELQKSSVGNGLQWGGSRLMWMGWVDVPNKGKAAGMGMVPELAPRLELDPLSFSFEMVALDLELAFIRFLRPCRRTNARGKIVTISSKGSFTKDKASKAKGERKELGVVCSADLGNLLLASGPCNQSQIRVDDATDQFANALFLKAISFMDSVSSIILLCLQSVFQGISIGVAATHARVWIESPLDRHCSQGYYDDDDDDDDDEDDDDDDEDDDEVLF
ncbi:hypothetical protein RHGRI_011413 [Rhododendron griersonianum]|uniref:MADS-box domain-containing protein n=1 Tax=Rhododendron griersonianum TaxID=479676 RepID=A0AAV6KLU6_9ERIC|nr:hypothetical protein RHGRI_011413 [Rhododendron griersonianum]